MARNLKNKISRATSCNHKLNKKVLIIKRSYDEVYSILNGFDKRKKKKKPY